MIDHGGPRDGRLCACAEGSVNGAGVSKASGRDHHHGLVDMANVNDIDLSSGNDLGGFLGVSGLSRVIGLADYACAYASCPVPSLSLASRRS
jgi:hypothetical protein